MQDSQTLWVMSIEGLSHLNHLVRYGIRFAKAAAHINECDRKIVLSAQGFRRILFIECLESFCGIR